MDQTPQCPSQPNTDATPNTVNADGGSAPLPPRQDPLKAEANKFVDTLRPSLCQLSLLSNSSLQRSHTVELSIRANWRVLDCRLKFDLHIPNPNFDLHTPNPNFDLHNLIESLSLSTLTLSL
ncbi:hypothetical protein CDL15_Pgr020325 [Punica granatum]|uniref:Uncharacterized protein n=1 Tax=Punica granatum TaxID=22663 RepID=A0A218VVR4_PUNGR|nr:hypothetical protein CDL15_Pgr020325 [Punica granatum]PKI54435.1 hypothetical protein CRG98_025222 [Punica granatum]